MMDATQQAYLHEYINRLQPTFAGKLFYYCLPFRKKVVLANMQSVFGSTLTPVEIKTLALSFYSHIATSLKENFFMRFMSQAKIKSKADIIGEEYLRDLEYNKIKGAIIITGHFGNWEFAPIAGILNYPKFYNRFYFVRKLIANKTVEKILFKRYYQAGLNVIPKKNSLDKVCEALEQHNAVVFVMDQHASIKARDGIFIDFFGKPAGTFKSPAIIAKHMQVPVLPARSYRKKNGQHVLEFLPIIPWQTHTDEKEELKINLRNYNQVLENLILEYPDQWLWMHKRWKTT